MLKRGINLVSSRSSLIFKQHHQIVAASSYHTTQNLFEGSTSRKVSVESTTTKSSPATAAEVPTSSAEPGAAFQIRGSVNSVHLIGTLTKDATIKEVGSNGAVLTGLTVVTSERRKKGEDIEEQSSFHNVVSFNPTIAKVAAKFFKKGTIVSIQGSLKYREVEKDGTKQIITQIVVDDYTDAKIIHGKYTKE